MLDVPFNLTRVLLRTGCLGRPLLYRVPLHQGKGDEDSRKKAMAATSGLPPSDPTTATRNTDWRWSITERGDLLRGYRVALNMLRDSPGKCDFTLRCGLCPALCGLGSGGRNPVRGRPLLRPQSGMLRSLGLAFLEHGGYDKALEILPPCSRD